MRRLCAAQKTNKKENGIKTQNNAKKCRNILSIQKKVVILQPFCARSAHGHTKTLFINVRLGGAERLNRCPSILSKLNKINGIQFLQDSVCQQGYR